MKRIGIYDSGIGGLSTLAKLIIKFPYCDYLYYSDNAHFPLGSMQNEELTSVVSNAIAYLEQSCEYVVLACNTASSHIADKSVFKLLPPLGEFTPQNTVVLATPNTLKKLKVKENGFQTIDTTDLASLITTLFEESEDRQLETTAQIKEMLRSQLDSKKYENIVLGCSHYFLIENLIKEISNKTQVYDGNERLILELEKVVEQNSHIGDIDFVFSGECQIELYVSILEKLLTSYRKMQD